MAQTVALPRPRRTQADVAPGGRLHLRVRRPDRGWNVPAQLASRDCLDRARRPPLDALFTSTSAVCLAGLAVVDTGTHWSTLRTRCDPVAGADRRHRLHDQLDHAAAAVGSGVTIRQRLLLREALGGGTLGSVLRLARRVIVFTLIVEAVGAAILTVRFFESRGASAGRLVGRLPCRLGLQQRRFRPDGRLSQLDRLQPRCRHPADDRALMLAGAISYVVVEDVLTQRRFVRLTLDTKLVLLSMTGPVGSWHARAAVHRARERRHAGRHAGVAQTAERVLHDRRADWRLRLDRRWQPDRGRPGGAHGADVRRWRGGLDGGWHQGPDLQHPVLRHRLVGSRAARRGGVPPSRAPRAGDARPVRRAARGGDRLRAVLLPEHHRAICVPASVVRGLLRLFDGWTFNRHHAPDQPGRARDPDRGDVCRATRAAEPGACVSRARASTVATSGPRSRSGSADAGQVLGRRARQALEIFVEPEDDQLIAGTQAIRAARVHRDGCLRAEAPRLSRRSVAGRFRSLSVLPTNCPATGTRATP